MAKSGKTKLSNLLVWVLLAMLIVGLAGFGVTGFGGQVRSVGSVGQTEIDASNYGRALQQEIEAMSQQVGEQVTFAQAEEIGVPQAVLQRLIATAALEEAARQAGLSVGDGAVGNQVQNMAAFQGVDGSFDRETYQFVLERSGLTPATYEESVRREFSARLLQAALLTGLTPPPTYGETLYGYFTDARAITFAEYGPDLLETPVETPDEDTVRAYYDANPEEFTAPAAKQITYAWLSPEMVADQVEVTEDDLRAVYEEQSELYNRPERRMVERLAFPDTAAAETALSAIEAGETTFDELVAERGLTLDDVDIGIVDEGDLGTQSAAEAVFALPDTGVVGPVDSAVGPALFRVNAILAAQSISFEDARSELEDAARLVAAADLVTDEIEALDDLLAGGATLEELADESAMELGTVSWSAETDAEGYPVTLPAFAAAADAVTMEDFPEITLAGEDIAFALRLDQETPAALRPFEDVRDTAAEGARQEAIRAELSARAEADLAALEGGETDFAALGLTPVTRDGITRQAPATDLPLPILSRVYDLAAGDIEIVEGAERVYLMRVDRIVKSDRTTPEAQQILAQVSAENARNLADDVLRQFASAISTSAGIHLDQTAINAVHSALR